MLYPHSKWWLEKENFSTQNAELVITTYASMKGWDAHMRDAQISGKWDHETAASRHINWLEMKAVILALKHFQQEVQGKIVLIRTDNSTVISYMYLNRQGEPSLQVCVY